ncbi:cytoplasmic tRNA 2-thiolation protein 2 [Plodia interpunctella]|uniref:cytoplasmic tRNA 2-thiolation protein 2 n=1 Tax=Plodia interpunctella TaxID=58824 RepID=UPI002368B953|nr:cytoplasmic tRNA 2-thiolation protein 2 [Plodia interpunctella]
MTSCKKCNAVGTVILRKIDSYCESCFLTGTNHKFRACLGRSKTLSSNEKVLICLTRGLGSTVLLDLVKNSLALDNHKKLRITPYFLHLKGYENDEENLNIASSIIEICQTYGFDVYISNISDYLNSDSTLPDVNTIQENNINEIMRFQKILNSMPPTAQNDFLVKVKRKLFIKFAKKLECKFIFTAETTTTLAIHLLSNIATGRGSQIQNDIGFSDCRDNAVTILRPVKDITGEELIHYINIKGLKVLHNQSSKGNSLQSVIKTFVTELQKNFPATIPTICKTADKIGMNSCESSNKCAICESDINGDSSKLSALEASSYSRMISLMEPPKRNSDKKWNENTSLFPYIQKSLCYGCSRNYSEMSNCRLPSHIMM